MKYFYLLSLIFLCNALSAQSDGFLIRYLTQDERKLNQHIYFNQINTRGNIVYTLQTYEYKDGRFLPKLELIEQNSDKDTINLISLDRDSLTAIASFGRYFDGNIGIVSVAMTDSNFYILYRLFDQNFTELEHKVFFLDNYSINKLSGLTYSLNAYEIDCDSFIYTTIDHPIFNGHSQSPRFIGYKFDRNGFLQLIAAVKSHDAVYCDMENNQLIFGGGETLLFYYDFDLNYIKQETVFYDFDAIHDTTFYLFNSFLQCNGKNYKLGKTTILYDQLSDSAVYVEGRSISEMGKNLKPTGNFVLTELPVTPESDGVARFGPTTFYRDGLIYTLFEYRNYNFSGPWRSTFLLTTFDTLLNIVEETHFRVDEGYKFFIEYCSLSEDKRFCVSGFCYYFDQAADSSLLGAYVLCFNKDGSQPPLENKEKPVFSSVITLRGNPTADYLRLYTEDINRPQYKITVTDMSGKTVVNSVPWRDPEQLVDVRRCPPGVYVYTIHHGGGVVFSGKFVKI